MNIEKLIEEHHEAMVDKGFYICGECEGQGFWTNDLGLHECDNCKGKGIDPNKNQGESLMLIVSELSEAMEADRKGHNIIGNDFYNFPTDEYKDIFAYVNSSVLSESEKIKMFEINIKDTFEDEIADVYLRLFDYCGYYKVFPKITHPGTLDFTENTAENIGLLSAAVLNGSEPGIKKEYWAGFILNSLNKFVEIHNIDIEKFIDCKMAYNKSRPHKHGKNY